MKIESGPELLVIDHRPVWVAVMLGLMMLVFAGMGIGILFRAGLGEAMMPLGGAFFMLPFIAIFVRRNQLILDRRSGELIHRRKSVLGYSETRHDLRHLREAKVETSFSDGSTTRRMSYVLDGGSAPGSHPFTSAFSSGPSAERAANAVNTWLARRHGEPRLEA